MNCSSYRFLSFAIMDLISEGELVRCMLELKNYKQKCKDNKDDKLGSAAPAVAGSGEPRRVRIFVEA